MAVKVNGTDAKDVAIHFLEQTQERYTSTMVGKVVVQAKVILKAGYTKEEIMMCIDYIVENTSVQMYSIGYISTAINSIIEKIKEEEKNKVIKKILDKQREEHVVKREGVKYDESKERNKRKLEGFGNESRFGEESPFDMLKE